MKRLKLENGWNVMANVDNNGHLTLYATNEDESRVLDLDSGMAGEQFFIKLTTWHIERPYHEVD